MRQFTDGRICDKHYRNIKFIHSKSCYKDNSFTENFATNEIHLQQKLPQTKIIYCKSCHKQNSLTGKVSTNQFYLQQNLPQTKFIFTAKVVANKIYFLQIYTFNLHRTVKKVSVYFKN